MTREELKLLNKATTFAYNKHDGQKYGDKNFIYHPMQVYEIIRLLMPEDINLHIAAILHDTLEQTETTEEEIAEEFGEDVAKLVLQTTKTGYNIFPKLKSTRAIILKFADRLCNLANMTSWDKDKQLRYINKSRFWKS